MEIILKLVVFLIVINNCDCISERLLRGVNLIVSSSVGL
jgi:hypothetical protein